MKKYLLGVGLALSVVTFAAAQGTGGNGGAGGTSGGTSNSGTSDGTNTGTTSGTNGTTPGANGTSPTQAQPDGSTNNVNCPPNGQAPQGTGNGGTGKDCPAN